MMKKMNEKENTLPLMIDTGVRTRYIKMEVLRIL